MTKDILLSVIAYGIKVKSLLKKEREAYDPKIFYDEVDY